MIERVADCYNSTTELNRKAAGRPRLWLPVLEQASYLGLAGGLQK